MRTFILATALLTIFAGCKKDDDSGSSETDNKQPSSYSYFPLETGNYWVYRHYRVDSNGLESDLRIMDSIIVSRDTFIKGHQYFVLEGTNRPYTSIHWGIVGIYRDSSGYMIDHNGGIVFTISNFKDVLYEYEERLPNGDLIYNSSIKMVKPAEQINVPAGSFESLNYRSTINIFDPYKVVENPRYQDRWFGKSIGRVMDTYFYLSSPWNIVEKRLIRYHLN